jgi:hypothetical protein
MLCTGCKTGASGGYKPVLIPQFLLVVFPAWPFSILGVYKERQFGSQRILGGNANFVNIHWKYGQASCTFYGEYADTGFMRPFRRGLPWWSFFGEVGVFGSWRSDDDDAGRQPRQRRSFTMVCVRRLVARVAVCALVAVVFHNGCWGVCIGFWSVFR